MGKPITREFTQSKTIDKYFNEKGRAACVIPQSMGVDDGNGNLIVKAGTPYPANDATCMGYVYVDVDVTRGDAAGTIRYEGDLDNKKIQENGVTISAEAKAATPRVTFWD